MKLMERPLKVLFVVSNMEIGGVQSGILNFAKVLSPDIVDFDLLVLNNTIGSQEQKFSKYGSIEHIPTLSSNNRILSIPIILLNNFRIKKLIYEYLKKHSMYDAVHSKSLMYSASIVEAAKKIGVPVRVAQSHVDKPKRLNAFHSWYYSWCSKRIQNNATDKLAVSPGAAELMFGKFGGRVIKNPTISLKRLNPSLYPKNKHEGINLIQIGTFSHRKNQTYSVCILSGLLKKGMKAKLTFIGYPLDEPDYITEIKNKVHDLGLDNYVEFLPRDSDVPKMLSESDYMLIPSLREGLPNVALEAQAMGVPCFISDSVNPDTDCGLCTFLSLVDGPEKWAETIINDWNQHKGIKRYVDMTNWDNECVCQEYIKIWNGCKENL